MAQGKTLAALEKIAGKSASAACRGLELDEPVLALRADGDSARAFLAKLIDARQIEGAIDVLANALPKREAVHWAASCAREITDAAKRDVVAAHEAAATWAKDPTDAHRRAAGNASELATLDTPAGCAALAAFLSEGSLTPPELVPVAPAEHLCGMTAGAAIKLAAQARGVAQAPALLGAFLDAGLKLADGPAPWESSPAKGAPVKAR